MKKFNFFLLTALLLLGVSDALAATATTVYYAVSSTTVGSYSVKLNVNLGKNSDNWQQYSMTKQNTGYRTYDIYKCEFTDTEDGVKAMQFQLYNGNTHVSEQAPIGAWTDVAYYNGQTYIHDKGWNSYEIRGSWDGWTAGESFNSEDKATLTLDPSNGDGYRGFTFKVVSKKNSDWFGKDENSIDIYPNNNSSSLSSTSGGNGYIVTSIAGEYTFEWNPISRTVTVTYPTTYTRSDLTAGAWGTLCLPVDGTVTGATLYNVAGKADGILYLTENANSTYATKGVPYIFKLGNSDTEISVSLNNSYYSSSASTESGLYGTYLATTINGSSEYLYAVSSNKVMRASSACNVGANRAWLNLTDDDDMKAAGTAVPDYDPEGLAPGHRIVTVAYEGNNTTDFDVIEASDKTVKFFQNGEIRILRNGVVYDATGRAIR